MSDNIFKFPNKGLEVEVELEDEDWDEQVCDSVFTILSMNIEGIVNTSDVEWHHIMDAALNIGLNAGLRAGITLEQMQDAIMTLAEKEYEYDA